MNPASTPFELQEFDRLLNNPAGDASGIVSIFTTGGILATRVPARLDVMGGIADYSGANVCEAVLGRGVLMGLQARTDRTLRIRTMQAGVKALPIETRLPLSAFQSGDSMASYAEIRALCQANPLASWATYIVGSIFTLLLFHKHARGARRNRDIDLASGHRERHAVIAGHDVGERARQRRLHANASARARVARLVARSQPG